MTEEQSTEIKSGTDLEIEQLRARLDAMERAHAEEVKTLKDANASLWAKAHPAPAEQAAEPAPVAPAWDDDKVLKAFNATLGIKEDD